jgi:hypothetical protein
VTTPYASPLRFTRTDAERRDPFRSWRRSDRAFFASGACHILASLFVQLHQHEGFVAEYLQPRDGALGSHMYATDGIWAFDFDGWTPKCEMLTVIARDYRRSNPAWDFDLIPVEGPVENHCAQLDLRSPQNFPHLPWARAYAYVGTFSADPPLTGDDKIPTCPACGAGPEGSDDCALCRALADTDTEDSDG